MTGVCLAIPGRIGSQGHLWTPAAGADREPKKTVATLTSTCSLPTAAPLCQTEINYPGESHCTAEHAWIRDAAASKGYLYFPHTLFLLFCIFSSSLNHTGLSISVIFRIVLHPCTLCFPHLSISLYFFFHGLSFSFLSLTLAVIPFSLWNNNSLICAVAKITSAFYIFLYVFLFLTVPLCSLHCPPRETGKRNTQKEIYLWLTFSRGIATFPRKSALLSLSSS